MDRNDLPAFPDPQLQSLVRRTARRLHAKRILPAMDHEDIEQALYCHVLQRIAAFDAGRGEYHALTATIVKRCAANIVRSASAAKRRGPRVTSLSANVSDGDGRTIDMAGVITERQRASHRGVATRSERDSTELASDVREVVSKLPVALQTVAQLLQSLTFHAASRRLGISRRVLRRYIQRIMRAFKRGDLHD